MSAVRKSKNWVVMSIPGRESADGTEMPTHWFAYNKADRRSIRFDSCEEAKRFVIHPDNQLP